jgi:hypothetical protein
MRWRAYLDGDGRALAVSHRMAQCPERRFQNDGCRKSP